MRAKYISPRSVFRSQTDYEDFPQHDALVRSLFPLLKQTVRIVIIARFCYGYDYKTICRRCHISKTTLLTTLDAFHVYDSCVHPVPLKEAL